MDETEGREINNICIITARGGSKRIPRKNIKPFLGKPIIQYSIEAALGASIFDEVMVSTDDSEIAEISVRAGASVPFMRSASTSDDHSTTKDVIIEVLSEYRRRGKNFDTYACLYPTAPFVSSAKLKDAMETFTRSGADSLIPVVRFSFPPQRGFLVQDGKLRMERPENIFVRSQDLEPMFHDCGQFYFGKSEKIFEYERLITPNTVPYIVSELEVQDIDDETDWKLAELKYTLINKKSSPVG